jgi:hypothetical protein
MLCAGTIAAAVFNANPFREKGSEAVSPLVFVPDYRAKFKAEERREQQQSLDAQIRELTRVLGCGPGKPN